MKELLTKKFWRDVKKTFDEAREDTTPRSAGSTASDRAELKPDGSPPEADSAAREPSRYSESTS
jgi:hypothetical protein